MPNATVKICGVYRLPPVTKEGFRNAVESPYWHGVDKAKAEELLRKELSSEVLVELIVENVKAAPDLDSLHQQGSDEDTYSHDEYYFSVDGENIVGDFWQAPPQADSYRIGFFLSFYDESKPLETPWGVILPPKVTDLPNRLKKLFEKLFLWEPNPEEGR